MSTSTAPSPPPGFVVSGEDDLLEWAEHDPPVIPHAEFEVRLNQL